MTSPFDSPSSDPFLVFHEWLALAEKSELNDPTAAALATASKAAVPSVRMVLVKGVDARGVRFFTNTESQKGSELHENPKAAVCFHWKSLRRQVRFEGIIETQTRSEIDQYFHSRSRASQVAAAVSAQSHPLTSRATLDDAVRKFTEELGDAPVPLPETWGGFLLVPNRIEFWKDGKDRLHDRMQFTRSESGWKTQRLYP